MLLADDKKFRFTKDIMCCNKTTIGGIEKLLKPFLLSK